MENSDVIEVASGPVTPLAADGGFGGHLVVQSNELVEASYTLTLHEHRILQCCIAQLDSRRPSTDQPAVEAGIHARWIKVSIADYVQTFPDCARSKSLPAELKEAADDLFEREIKLKAANGDDYRIRWLGARAVKKDGAILLNFSESVLPYLTALKGSFTKYHLRDSKGLRQPNSIRMFEHLQRNRHTGVWLIELEDFIERLDLPYDRFTDVRRRVIEPAISEIEEKSNLIVDWKPIKDGRAVKWLEFRFRQGRREPKPEQGDLF